MPCTIRRPPTVVRPCAGSDGARRIESCLSAADFLPQLGNTAESSAARLPLKVESTFLNRTASAACFRCKRTSSPVVSAARSAERHRVSASKETICASGHVVGSSAEEWSTTVAVIPRAAQAAAQSAAPVRSSAIATICVMLQLPDNRAFSLLEEMRAYHQAVRKGAARALTITLHATSNVPEAAAAAYFGLATATSAGTAAALPAVVDAAIPAVPLPPVQ